MTIGAALALIVVGAILRFAITTSVNGIVIPTIGLILMIVGAIGVVLWLIFWAPWARTRRVVYREGVPPEEVAPPARTRRVVYREDVPPEEVAPPARTRRVVYREDVPPEALPSARRYPADTRYGDEYRRKRLWPGIGSLSAFAGVVAAELVAVAAADARGIRRAARRAIGEPVGLGTGLGERVRQRQSGWLESPGHLEIHGRDELYGRWR